MCEMKQDWQTLLKFGERQHIESFRRDGLLHMNSSDYFSTLEGDHVRTDRFEGTDQIQQPHSILQIRIEDAENGKVFLLKPEDLGGPMLVNFGRSRYNIFCMFAAGNKGDGFLVDKRNFAFGDSFIIVLNTQAFVDRVCAAAAAANFDCQYRPIEYYDVIGHHHPGLSPGGYQYAGQIRRRTPARSWCLGIAKAKIRHVRRSHVRCFREHRSGCLVLCACY